MSRKQGKRAANSVPEKYQEMDRKILALKKEIELERPYPELMEYIESLAECWLRLTHRTPRPRPKMKLDMSKAVREVSEDVVASG